VRKQQQAPDHTVLQGIYRENRPAETVLVHRGAATANRSGPDRGLITPRIPALPIADSVPESAPALDRREPEPFFNRRSVARQKERTDPRAPQ
jgi:hypothetical protein